MVHSVKIIKIELTARKSRSIETINKLIIRRERYRLETACLKMYAQTLAECGLPLFEGSVISTSSQDQKICTAGYFLCNLNNLLLLQSLGNPDEIVNLYHLADKITSLTLSSPMILFHLRYSLNTPNVFGCSMNGAS